MTTKPWEEEWGQDANATDWVNVVDGGRTKVICRFGSVVDKPKARDIARARLASKAPKMARALLEDVKVHARSPEPSYSCGCPKCELLREAGVLE